MPSRQETLALVRDLADAGVSRASLGAGGELLSVEFFERVPGLEKLLAGESPKEVPEAIDPVTEAALKLSGRAQR
jgi:hypothetical protein